eukprot:TCONS_00031676-protein
MSFTKNMLYVSFDFERDHAGSGLDITNFISMINQEKKPKHLLHFVDCCRNGRDFLKCIYGFCSVLHVESRVRKNNGATFPRLTSQSMMNGIYREFNGNKGFGFCTRMNMQRGKGKAVGQGSTLKQTS